MRVSGKSRLLTLALGVLRYELELSGAHAMDFVDFIDEIRVIGKGRLLRVKIQGSIPFLLRILVFVSTVEGLVVDEGLELLLVCWQLKLRPPIRVTDHSLIQHAFLL